MSFTSILSKFQENSFLYYSFSTNQIHTIYTKYPIFIQHFFLARNVYEFQINLLPTNIFSKIKLLPHMSCIDIISILKSNPYLFNLLTISEHKILQTLYPLFYNRLQRSTQILTNSMYD